ncbi:MAG: F0F1 ATP synthase subunit A [Paludibacteraceae bacterium]
MNIAPLYAAEQSEEKKSFDIKEMIFSHVLDAYEWHLFTVGDKHVSIPLPVIVKGDDGWHVFSSSRLSHGHEYEGFHISHDEHYNGKIVTKNASGEIVRPLDLSLTKNAASILLASLMLILILLSVALRYKKDPIRSMKGFGGAIEQLTMSIYNDIIKPSIPNDYKRFTPYLLTIFYFIFFNNLLGLVPFFPGGANVTGNIAVTLVLALLTFIATNFFGNKAYWKEVFWPDVPIFLKTPVFPLMQFIEIIGILTKPFALMIRLFANILAGHMIILVLMGLIFMFAALMGIGAAVGVSVVSVAFGIFMTLLEVLVAFIQAYVFTMLSAIFIGMARAEHH